MPVSPLSAKGTASPVLDGLERDGSDFILPLFFLCAEFFGEILVDKFSLPCLRSIVMINFFCSKGNHPSLA